MAAGAAGMGSALLSTAVAANQSVTAGGTDSYGYSQLRFTPQTVTINAGETVTWTNAGGTHNVHFDDPSLSCQMPATPQPPSGWGGGSGKVSCTFPHAGTFTYHCDLHAAQGMTGEVVVNGSGTAPGTTNPPPTTTTPYSTPTPTTTTPTTPSNPSNGPAGTAGAPALSGLTANSRQRGHVAGHVMIGQDGSEFEADLVKGQGTSTVTAAVARPGQAAVATLLGKTVKANVPAGPLQFQVALNRRGRKLLKRKGKLKALLEVAVTLPGGTRKVASARVTMTAR